MIKPTEKEEISEDEVELSSWNKKEIVYVDLESFDDTEETKTNEDCEKETIDVKTMKVDINSKRIRKSEL